MARAGQLQHRKPARTSQDPSHGVWEVLSLADEDRKASAQPTGLPLPLIGSGDLQASSVVTPAGVVRMVFIVDILRR